MVSKAVCHINPLNIRKKTYSKNKDNFTITRHWLYSTKPLISDSFCNVSFRYRCQTIDKIGTLFSVFETRLFINTEITSILTLLRVDIYIGAHRSATTAYCDYKKGHIGTHWDTLGHIGTIQKYSNLENASQKRKLLRQMATCNMVKWNFRFEVFVRVSKLSQKCAVRLVQEMTCTNGSVHFKMPGLMNKVE